MKPKTLFLAKFFACSAALFVVWNPVSDVYISALNHIMSILHSVSNFVSGWNKTAFGMKSLLLIPLISLVLATPKTKLARKAMFLAGGVAIFILADILLFEFVLVVRKGEFQGEESAVWSAYESFKWLMPFLTWITMAYPNFGGLFRKG